KELMADALEPRHYHNSAMLLPNGKIFVSGGNTARATVRTGTLAPKDPKRQGQPLPDLSLVDVDMYFFNDGPMAKGQKGMLTSPTHGWENGKRFYELPAEKLTGNQVTTLEFTMPSAAGANLPPAYYMMFYVDCRGKPSAAQMVRFDNAAVEP